MERAATLLRKSTICPMGIPLGKMPPSPLVITACPGLICGVAGKILKIHQVVIKRSSVEIMMPVLAASSVLHQRADSQIRIAQKEDLRSVLSTTVTIRPTKPSVVNTGKLARTPCFDPASIRTVRHQLAGSRAMTRASFNFHGDCFCQPKRLTELRVLAQHLLRSA